MPSTLAFDVYGTLVDTAGVTTQLTRWLGDRAPEFAGLWREKQLEYAFRRGLMRNYRTFAVCTRQALDYCCQALEATLDEGGKQALMAAYARLPAFPEAPESLERFTRAGHRVFAFSNGAEVDVREVLNNAGIAGSFEGVVSVDTIRSFKPDPAVYAHFLRIAAAPASETWLISGNPFDVIGARSAGLRAAWIKRRPEMVSDPWELTPTVEVPDLAALADHFRC
jgi:2-haloacid dehalogenase